VLDSSERLAPGHRRQRPQQGRRCLSGRSDHRAGAGRSGLRPAVAAPVRGGSRAAERATQTSWSAIMSDGSGARRRLRPGSAGTSRGRARASS
jgi:hypothetical protein